MSCIRRKVIFIFYVHTSEIQNLQLLGGLGGYAGIFRLGIFRLTKTAQKIRTVGLFSRGFFFVRKDK